MLVRKEIYVSVGVALSLLTNPALGQNQEQGDGRTIEMARIVGSQADARAIAGSVNAITTEELEVFEYTAINKISLVYQASISALRKDLVYCLT